ncbi:hypothetical protein LA080_008413 [Diaporthe eres]|nr:hypothetical protein LA080_008413 [Diaporthe eres]
MAVGPFVQQLIQPVDCMEELSGAPAASVPTTIVITYGDVPDALQPSIVAGFYTSQNLTDFERITGNCTFAEDYTTIGFCSSCEDVSAKVTITTNCTVIANQSVTPHQGPCDGWIDGSEGASIPVLWNITTAYPPFNLTFYHNWLDSTIFDQWADQDVPYQDDTPDVFTMKSSRRWVPDLLDGKVGGLGQVEFGVDLGVIDGMSEDSIYRHEPTNPQQNLTGCDDASSNNTWYCRGYGAATCLIQPCLKTYSAGVQAGRLTETLVEHTDPASDWGYSQVDGDKFVKGYFGLVDKSCISNDQHQQLAASGYDSVGDAQARWLPYKMTYDPTHPNATAYNATLSSSLLASHCLFLVDELFVDGIWEQVLNKFLLGTVKRYSTGYDPLSSADIGRGGRSGGQDGLLRGRANGQVLHYATCAQVAWAWIALPAVLTSLTLLVLAATVVATARDQVPVWKSSPLTLLFHGPGGRYWVEEGLVATANAKESDGKDIGTKRGMEKFSARFSVKLGDNGGRGELRLRQVSAVSQKKT